MDESTPEHFASVTDADVDAVISDRTPKSTKDATRYWVRIFNKFRTLYCYWTPVKPEEIIHIYSIISAGNDVATEGKKVACP